MKTNLRPLKLWALIAGLQAVLAAPASAQTPPPIDEQFEQYWGTRHSIPNVEKRLFAKAGRHEGTLLGGTIPNDPFYKYYPLGARYDWYPIEDLAIELSGTYVLNTSADLQTFIESDLRAKAVGVRPQQLEWTGMLGVLWVPFQGKIGIFSAKMGHFDLALAGGIGGIGTQIQKATAETEANIKTEADIAFGGYVGATLRFYILEWFAMRVDYRHFFYGGKRAENSQSDTPTVVSDGVHAPAEITLGFSFFTPAH